MRRKHTFAEFEQIVNYAREKIPEIGLGTDIMVGYPGEDEQSFKTTKQRVADLPLNYFHVFTYSDRKGTTAFKLKPKVPYQVKKERTRTMIKMGERKKFIFYQAHIGQTVTVLFEQNFKGYWEGFTGNYMRVRVPSQENLKNQIRSVKLTDVIGDKLQGELI